MTLNYRWTTCIADEKSRYLCKPAQSVDIISFVEIPVSAFYASILRTWFRMLLYYRPSVTILSCSAPINSGTRRGNSTQGRCFKSFLSSKQSKQGRVFVPSAPLCSKKKQGVVPGPT